MPDVVVAPAPVSVVTPAPAAAAAVVAPPSVLDGAAKPSIEYTAEELAATTDPAIKTRMEAINAGLKPKAVIAAEAKDLKLPEGSLLDASRLDKIAAYAKAQGLSAQQAQAVLEAESESIKAFAEERQAQFRETAKGWATQSMADPEIGGEKFNENIALANRVLEKYADPKLTKELKETGFGNHPELVRLLVRIGKNSSEDTLVTGKTTVAKAKDPQDIMYPDKKE